MIGLSLSLLGDSPLGVCILGSSPAAEAGPVNAVGEFATWLRGRLGINVYPNKLPKKEALPLLSYAIIDGRTEMQLAGATRLRRYQFQFDAWADGPSAAFQIQTDLFEVLGTYRGPVGRATLQAAIPGRVMTSFEPSPAKGDAGYFRAMGEWEVILYG